VEAEQTRGGSAAPSPAPLSGLRAVHLASLGPGPYAAMLLADLGCDVVIVDRTTPMTVSVPPEQDPRRRGQRSICLDLTDERAASVLDDLLRGADVLIEGMRPGVAERLGFGPDRVLELNPRLVYGRMTGWGQDGPFAPRAGHDINYIGLSGALHAMGDADRPPPVPLNLLGDYAGGGVFLALGVVAALVERGRSGRGQVIDAAIVDGVASLSAATMGMLAAGSWGDRGENIFDGAAPWYRTYGTEDGGYVAVGGIEPQFYRALLEGVELDPAEWPQHDRSRWSALADELGRIFGSRSRKHWEERFADTDACVSPAITFAEAPSHPHHVARQTYIEVGGVVQPAPAPRLSRSPHPPPAPPPARGADTDEILSELGRTAPEILALREAGVVA
jgi:alpha-methylacyl-CoA racemase